MFTPLSISIFIYPYLPFLLLEIYIPRSPTVNSNVEDPAIAVLGILDDFSL